MARTRARFGVSDRVRVRYRSRVRFNVMIRVMVRA